MKNFDSFWMPFTSNRTFRNQPRLLERAEGVYYYKPGGEKVLDLVAGLWCCNAGHGHPKIVEAIQSQAAELDYAPHFNFAHTAAFELAEQLTGVTPAGLDHVFFTNSGSESVDTALKIALAYQRERGKATKTRLIGRERGYHGVGFGGISVGGIPYNRMQFSTALIPGVDHLPHTHLPEKNAFSRGLPAEGAYLADELERLVTLHHADNIAAVIVEPVAGSAGVLVPPVGYLKRLREICDRHDILLIFDEVITGFGRLGAPFAAQEFDVVPDMITTAKALTSGTVPMGAVFVADHIYNAFMERPGSAIELFHGYTYSAHPLAVAACRATQQVYAEDGLFDRARELAPVFEDALHSLADAPGVIDVRNYGLMGAVEMAPDDGAPGARGMRVLQAAFDAGLMIRITGDTIAFSPPLTIEAAQLEGAAEKLGVVLAQV
ncbi:aspartate aminotransferase family protein [Marinihelvus fidelis]|uniref:Aspartate aminotransferase family protein n=1 Tax=Marinihelvus fidelis TaxID=2613842 RepID=A0A5N0T9N3_9GAMM|nr:aspartate aminotransferase family protein [Marinihelvus fidelis]KAA9130837.1 aspartate aminotransferase family protein [Marinihelvus fidelis]